MHNKIFLHTSNDTSKHLVFTPSCPDNMKYGQKANKLNILQSLSWPVHELTVIHTISLTLQQFAMLYQKMAEFLQAPQPPIT